MSPGWGTLSSLRVCYPTMFTLWKGKSSPLLPLLMRNGCITWRFYDMSVYKHNSSQHGPSPRGCAYQPHTIWGPANDGILLLASSSEGVGQRPVPRTQTGWQCLFPGYTDLAQDAEAPVSFSVLNVLVFFTFSLVLAQILCLSPCH